jgi:hypothetical protein
VAKTVYWIATLWIAALIATFAAVYVMQMGYRIDALQSQYTGLVRQNEELKAEVAVLSSPTNLERDALRLKVTLHAPKPIPDRVQRPARSKPPANLAALVRGAFRSLREALTGR